jgi:histidinol-phosphate aminotransferase
MSYFRENIEAMQGYAPGAQPKAARILKLNTNENPYPPSPKAVQALRDFDLEALRKYPEPLSRPVAEAASEVYGCELNEVIVGNGSDDILTILIRSFAGETDIIGSLNPSYSLYPVLANIQGASFRFVDLNEDFSLPENLLEQAAGCSLFFLTCPNAPTANSFDREKIRAFCRDFKGIAVIDEAYGDFAEENFLDLYKEFPNVVISRTFSKSYSLAGIRVGLAFANAELISGMMNVKDSYNVNALSQVMAAAALRDQTYFAECRDKVITAREKTAAALSAMGFQVLPSQTNFLFAAPPVDAAEVFNQLNKRHIYVRYFKGDSTGRFLRITIGTDEEMDEFLGAIKEIIS